MLSVALNAFLGGFVLGVVKATSAEESRGHDCCGGFESIGSNDGATQDAFWSDGDAKKKVGFKH